MNWWKRREDDLDRELRAHLELEAEEQGDAAKARRALGNVTLIKEDTRAAWGFAAIERIFQDLRYAARTMRRSPGFTAVAVLSLALGIGANTAIFTFVNAALLKPLPYPRADRIVALRQSPLKGGAATLVHPRSFVPWHDRAQSFEALAIAQAIPVNTQGADGAEQVPGLWMTPGLFRVFGVTPALGRGFTEEEGGGRASIRGEAAPGDSVVILSHGYWQRRFGADRGIVGSRIPVGSGRATVIGVMPAGFRVGSLDADIYSPIRMDRANPGSIGSRGFLCFGRLRDGVTVEAARAEMAVVAEQVGRDDPGEKEWGVTVLSLRDYLVSDTRLVLLVLAGAVAVVLLIACANLGGLLLARGIGRASELALRASLGASRGRLVQQLIVESSALSLAGGALGLLFGSAGSRALVTLAQEAVAFGQLAEVSIDARVFAFTAGLSLATALAFGLLPAWRASRADLQTGLKAQARGSSGSRGQQRFRSMLVAGEVALAAILLVGAGLLLRTFSQLLDVKLGFQPEQAVTMRMLILGEPAHRANLVERILDRVETLPGVRAAGTIQFLPLGGWTNNGAFHFVGRPLPPDPAAQFSDVSTVSRGYFAAMGIPVLRGRAFSRQDRFESPRVALVNESWVRKYSSGEDPIGRVIQGDWANPKPTTIIGVAGDLRHNGLTAEPVPTVFLAQAQVPGYFTNIVVRTAEPVEGIARAVRREVREVDPRQPVTDVQPMGNYVAAALAKPRLYAVLLGAFAGLALGLAAIGLYGLIAYTVRQRTHEIGVRIALGARPASVFGSILGRACLLTGTGLAIGIGAGALLASFLSKLLYGVEPGDLSTYAAVAIAVGGVAIGGAFLPASRAARVDPMTALRNE